MVVEFTVCDMYMYMYVICESHDKMSLYIAVGRSQLVSLFNVRAQQ